MRGDIQSLTSYSSFLIFLSTLLDSSSTAIKPGSWWILLDKVDSHGKLLKYPLPPHTYKLKYSCINTVYSIYILCIYIYMCVCVCDMFYHIAQKQPHISSCEGSQLFSVTKIICCGSLQQRCISAGQSLPSHAHQNTCTHTHTHKHVFLFEKLLSHQPSSSFYMCCSSQDKDDSCHCVDVCLCLRHKFICPSRLLLHFNYELRTMQSRGFKCSFHYLSMHRLVSLD